mmetsp:Transcript_82158/g.232894  ORF Transcript_82158/g.232894 Transcript_82158/m.232894 type:complete len:325 (+) Transcript_82158:120-1094(+)
MVSASVLRPSGLAKMRSRSSSRSKIAWPCVVRPRRAARPTYCNMPATDVVSAKDFVTTTVDAGTLAPQVNSFPAVTQASLFAVMLSCTHCVYTGFPESASSFGSKDPAPESASICHLSSTGRSLIVMNSLTFGRMRGMVTAFAGRFGHHFFRNCSDWITRSGENFRRGCADSTCSPSSAYLFSFAALASCALMSSSRSDAFGMISISRADMASICSAGWSSATSVSPGKAYALLNIISKRLNSGKKFDPSAAATNSLTSSSLPSFATASRISRAYMRMDAWLSSERSENFVSGGTTRSLKDAGTFFSLSSTCQRSRSVAKARSV